MRFPLFSRREPDREPELSALDRDALLVAAFLAGDATPDEEAEFERRYVEDDAFYAEARETAEIWFAPIDWHALARPDGGLKLAEPARANAGDRLLKALLLLSSVTVAITVVYNAANWVVIHKVRPLLLTQEPDRVVSVTPVQASAVRPTVPEPGVAASPAAADAQPLAPLDSGKFASSLLKLLGKTGRTLTTAPDVQTLLQFARGSRVLLGPGAEVRYATSAVAAYGVLLDLRDGEASVRVAQGDPVMQVITPAGIATLSAGTFAVRCVTTSVRCGELDVTAAGGSARLRLGGINGEGVNLAVGTFGRMRRGEVPAYLAPAAARGFPQVDPALMRQP